MITIAFTGFVLSCKHQLPDAVPAGTVPGAPLVTGRTCSPDTVYFAQQVLPILNSNCAFSGCHGTVLPQEGVVLTSYATVMATAGIRPGNANDSELYEMITERDHDDRMPPPPRNPLSQQQIDVIYKWIQQGARNLSCETACDSARVTYSATIRPLIGNYCGGCHNGTGLSGGIDLSTYNGLRAKVADGRLWGALNHLQGFSPMPKNSSKLSDCNLAQIRKWIAAGAPNN